MIFIPFFLSCPSCLAKCKQRLRNIFVFSQLVAKVTENQKRKIGWTMVWIKFPVFKIQHKTATYSCLPFNRSFSLVFATYVVAWQDGFDLMVANDFGHTENYAVFGVIFAFICLLSGLFSCLISVIARKGSSKNILPKYRLISFRKSLLLTLFWKIWQEFSTQQYSTFM